MERRSFLKFTMAGSALGMTVGLTGCQQDLDPVDVIIIGAGLAGLSAARELQQQGVESFHVLEAAPRIGGRVLNQSLGDDFVVDGGAQWVGRTQTEMLALIDEFGLSLFPSHDVGDTLVYMNGQAERFPAETPENEDENFAIARQLLDDLAATIPVEHPWSAPNATELDAVSVAEWMQANNFDESSYIRIDSNISATMGASADQVSLLYYLFYLNSAGGFYALESFKGGAQEFIVSEGVASVAKNLADAITGQIFLDTPVTEIDQTDPDLIKIKTKGLFNFSARKVIVAMMPAQLTSIDFKPGLPEQKQQLIKNWTGTSGIKAHVRYEYAFWREQGLSGNSITDTAIGATFDRSPENGIPGVIEMFIPDELALLFPALKKQLVLDDLKKVFGPEAGEVLAYVEQDWTSERWQKGCVSALRPNVLTQYGSALREAFGGVIFAGTETAEVWNGYMEGAVRSGRRAALEVVGELVR